jgi:poly-gamma-glutamate capsule biosynthesis protein CapA/YwtB (metallophosphatase superfamily)
MGYSYHINYGTKTLKRTPSTSKMSNSNRSLMSIFLAGDCMLGRGIDASCKQSCNPQLHEGYCTSALDYVQLAEQHSGPIPRSCAPSYFWGSALKILDQYQPHARIINLETSVTERESFAREKGIHYRMHPQNLQILKDADIDAVSLANNHVADFGPGGLVDTINELKKADVKYAGAGMCAAEAEACALIPVQLRKEGAHTDKPQGRILLYSTCHPSSGVPPHWSATPSHPGVHMTDLSSQSVHKLSLRIAEDRKEDSNDVVLLAIHWGGNWGYDIDPSFTQYAHDVIDQAGVDVVFGHPSHHPQTVEIDHIWCW